jgi:outer membrane immunogenic protein
MIDTFVFGVEADVSYTGADGSSLAGPLLGGVAPGVPLAGTFQTLGAEMDWFGTARLRAGVAVAPEVLLYATGGLAWGRLDYDSFTAFAPPGPSPVNYVGSHSTTRTGWTAGGGIEWAASPGWSVKLEYLYYDLGSSSHIAFPQLPNAPFAVSQSYDVDGHIVRAGVNYRFSW